MKWFILIPFILVGCFPGWPEQYAPAEAYDRLVTSSIDHSTGDTLYLFRYSGVSYGDRGFGYHSRYLIDLHFVKTGDVHESVAQMALRYSPSEWPLDDTMAFVIDDHVYHVPLEPVNTRDVAKFTGSGMDGDVSVTTYETQIVRAEARIPDDILHRVKPGSKLLLVFHAGIFPVTFEWSDQEVKYLIAFTRV